ncbi:MAG: hypothetical protein RLZZ283_671 [Candidatus Parcubacteria bacterium]
MRFLVDCGLSQGGGTAGSLCESPNAEPFIYDPATVDALFFTHAHADHIGLYPKLVLAGFKGKAYATHPTADLMPVMLEDSVQLIAKDAERCHQKPLYALDDIAPAMARVTAVSYHQKIDIAEGITATMYNAGHIVGSALIVFDIHGTKLLFTGDLGRTPAILVPDREVPEHIDYLVTESVYGNRAHGDKAVSDAMLAEAVRRTVKNNGVLLIPAFSLERTQIILSSLETMMKAGTIPDVAVYMDSPLADKVTRIYRDNPEYLRDDIKGALAKGDDPFSFRSLKVTVNKEASSAIDHAPTPKVIIAGAGMSHGGRIRHHEERYLGNPSTTVLLVGYQVAGSLGRRIRDGARVVDINHKKVRVRAHVEVVDGYSAHADRDDLLQFAEAIKPKKAFVVLGETEASTFLAQRISGFLGIPAHIPREGEVVEL